MAIVVGTVGCGGISSSSSPAQGFYVGTAVIGGVQNVFDAILLPNGQLFALYDSATQGFGTFNGQGATTDGNYIISNLGILPPGAVFEGVGSLEGTQQGSELEGSVTIPAENLKWGFYAQPPASTSYIYNTPGQLTAVAGKWKAGLWTTSGNYGSGYGTASIGESGLQIDQTGSFSSGQAPDTCNYSGSLTPDSAHNFYDVSVTYSGSCPTLQLIGVGVVTVSNPLTGTKQLQVVLNDGEGFVASYNLASQ
jgi:hypothetical protein